MFSIVKTLFKSLRKGPATVKYPYEPIKPFERSRGHIDIDINNCIFCGLCSRKCPTGGINVSKPDTKWSIDRLKCVQCNSCVESCPKKCLHMSNETPSVYSREDKVKEVSINARVSDNKADNKAE